jgi:hypothetical protein
VLGAFYSFKSKYQPAPHATPQTSSTTQKS